MFDQTLPDRKIQKDEKLLSENKNSPIKRLIEKPVNADCFTSIVIPVRDEAELIEKCLAAFTRQIDLKTEKVDPKLFEIIILANNCADNSVEIIEKFRRQNSHLQIHTAEVFLDEENRNIGFVRKLLMDEAHARLKKNRFGKGVIVTTDGDTTVADDWICANLREIESGADAVGGRIIINGAELEKMDALCREFHLKDEEYRLLAAEIEDLIDELPFDHAPRHHQHFNGSFAVTTEMYEKAGGLPEVKFLEDIAFFDRLQKMDARIRHSPNVEVFTSSRHVGRSEVGLSFQLNLWKNLRQEGEDFLVESAEAIIERFTAKKLLRKIWRNYAKNKKTDGEKISIAAGKIFVGGKFISEELKKQKTFGEFYESLMVERNKDGKWLKYFPMVSLDTALDKLKKEAEKRRRQSFSQTSMR
ncbi:MAG: glycosyltransferase family A protein [Pyrinomonadaceae bacterium]